MFEGASGWLAIIVLSAAALAGILTRSYREEWVQQFAIYLTLAVFVFLVFAWIPSWTGAEPYSPPRDRQPEFRCWQFHGDQICIDDIVPNYYGDDS